MSYCAHKHLLAQIWQFKSRSDLEKIVNQISSSSCPNVISVQIWLSLPTSSWDMVHTSTFWLKFDSLSPALTLKIRSRSPELNQLFIMSQCYIRENLVKIQLLVHEISCKQEIFTPTPTPTLTPTLTPMPTGSAPKTIYPLPFGGGQQKQNVHTLYLTRGFLAPLPIFETSDMFISL